MGTKTNAKRLRPSTKRQKRKPPMSKRIKTAIRTNLMDEKPIDEIKQPRAITRAGGDALTNFRAELSSTKLDEMDVYFKKINKNIGVGAFAKRANLLPNFPGVEIICIANLLHSEVKSYQMYCTRLQE